jgi:hypothetical protein
MVHPRSVATNLVCLLCRDRLGSHQLKVSVGLTPRTTMRCCYLEPSLRVAHHTDGDRTKKRLILTLLRPPSPTRSMNDLLYSYQSKFVLSLISPVLPVAFSPTWRFQRPPTAQPTLMRRLQTLVQVKTAVYSFPFSGEAWLEVNTLHWSSLKMTQFVLSVK